MRLSLRLLVFSVLVLLITLPDISASQAGSQKDGDLLLEITFTSCSKSCDSETTRLYASGRFVREIRGTEMAKSGRHRPVLMTEEKRLEPDEIAEVISWAEQPDFLNAEPEYIVTTIDSPQKITIIYANNGKEKRIVLANFNLGTAAQKARVPASVLKLARWAQPYHFAPE
jgi:hypothetical protein